MWSGTSLLDFYKNPTKGPVWKAPESGPQSQLLWAPELHALRGRWYIYFAGADKTVGNRSHRMYVLGGPPTDEDPHSGPWQLLSFIVGMDQGQWAIDGTVFEIDNTLYFCYSGWPRRDNTASGWEERDEKLQQLFIIRLKDPITADSETVMISHPDNDWERLVGPGVGINEGPQWLESPTKHWRGLVYSCSASWTKHYKMATLKYDPAPGKGPLDPSSWQKSAKPLLQNRPEGEGGPYGPGHGCFLHADNKTVALFHATDKPTDGNRNRRCRMQRVHWTDQGPDMGRYVGAVTADMDIFDGVKPVEPMPRDEL